MARKLILILGILSIAVGGAARFFYLRHSNLTDFTQLVATILIFLFLVALFVIRPQAFSARRRTRIVFRIGKGVAALLLVILAFAIFWPRHYGSPAFSRANTRYWDLPSGSHIAYTMVPAAPGVPKQPTPIIFLQGGPGGAIYNGNVRDLAPFAADGYDIYLYDQVGCGLSGRLDDIKEYTTVRHKQDLEAIVNKIGASKVILFGHSWGAILAVLYVADNPDRVDRIIVTGPGSIPPVHYQLVSLAPPDSLHLKRPYYSNRQGNEAAANIRSRFMAFCALQFGRKLASDAEADDFGGYLTSWVDRSTVADTSLLSKVPRPAAGIGYYDGLMTVASFPRTPDPRPRLRTLSTPVLVMRGQYDNQPWGYANEYLQLFSHHQLIIIPGAGHSGIERAPNGLFYSAIRNFLKK